MAPLLFVLLAGFSLSGCTTAPGHAGHSPYAGQQTRQIKSLSAADINELQRGGGWGLAKAAELNGIPGPAHLLELKDQIPLTAPQVLAVRALFDRMQAGAKSLGMRMVELERSLDAQFRERRVTTENLAPLLAEIGKVRSDLRFVHLAAHLEVPGIISAQQIQRYNQLRGYGKDPCAAVPAGHNAAKWRRHNGCTQ